jgi:preprotein translocase subunit SecF
MDIVGKRYIYFLISLILIVPGIVGLIIWGLPLAVDFAGGSIVELHFKSVAVPPLQEIRDLYAEYGHPDAEPRSSGEYDLVVRSKHMDNQTNQQIIQVMQERFGTEIEMVRFESVGPTIGREVTTRAILTIALAALAIMFYIWYAFRGVKNAHRYGISAIIAMLHDVAVVFGMQAILSHFLGWEIDSLFLTALLTVISFSVHDSIVVFDRIRENSTRTRGETYESIVNRSIVQTMARSINTQLTVFLTLLALLVFGGSTLRHFIVILMIGLLSGTYSSIFNASPILVVWENQEWKNWFRRKNTTATA